MGLSAFEPEASVGSTDPLYTTLVQGDRCRRGTQEGLPDSRSTLFTPQE